MSTISNPLLQNSGLPRFQDIKTVDVEPAVLHDIEFLKTGLATLEQTLSSADTSSLSPVQLYQLSVEQLERIKYPLSYSWGVVSHLMGVKDSDDLRAIHDILQPKVIEVKQAVGQNEVLYQTLLAIKSNSASNEALEPAQIRIVDEILQDMKFSGIGFSSEDRVIFNRLKVELAELDSKFSNNVSDSIKSFKLVITDKSELDGLPESVLALALKQGKALTDSPPVAPITDVDAGTTETDTCTPVGDRYVLTLDYPCYQPSMQHLKNRPLREQLYRAFISRASSGPVDNAPLIRRILQLKRETARMLGFDSFAEQSLAKKMAPSVASVLKLLELLRETSYPAAQKDLEAVKAFKLAFEQRTQQQQPPTSSPTTAAEELQLWDVPFWSERQREADFEFAEEDLRPYFPLPAVLQGMFDLAHRLFGITVTSAATSTSTSTTTPLDTPAGSTDPASAATTPSSTDSAGVQVWHPDVQFFHIADSVTNQHIASFYLDPYSRPEDKRGGAWMDVCLGKSKVMDQKPVAYLVCNGSPPMGSTPSLMTFREVETLFHEFGHGLQHMLTTVEHGDAAGINGIEWDAVELPSQFMENWCYDPRTLFGFARHHATHETMPVGLFEKVKAAKNYQAGYQMLRQLSFGAVDMRIHSLDFEAAEIAAASASSVVVAAVDAASELQPESVSVSVVPLPVTAFEVQQQMAPHFSVLPPLKDDRFLCSFSHIFAGGYSAGYYSYMWAEVMSADAFAAFEENGLEDEFAVQATGRLFRNTVLAHGGGKHPGEVFREFRGRDPTPDALLRHSGLKK